MMYKQLQKGFRRKAVPISIVGGMILLTISYYEAIWQTSYGMWISYLIPTMVLTAFAIIMFMLTFVSYEYRLLHNQIVFRKLVFDRPHKAVVLNLEKEYTVFEERYRIGQYLRQHKQHYYLPLLDHNKVMIISCRDENGVPRHVLFKPGDRLAEMIRDQINSLGQEEPENISFETEEKESGRVF